MFMYPSVPSTRGRTRLRDGINAVAVEVVDVLPVEEGTGKKIGT